MLPATGDVNLKANYITTTLALALRSDLEGEPYTPALTHLRTIARDARAVRVRHFALQAYAHTAPRDSGLAILREVAVSRDSVAPVAIFMLMGGFGSEGVGILRELYMNDLVVDARARNMLNHLAFQAGWVRQDEILRAAITSTGSVRSEHGVRKIRPRSPSQIRPDPDQAAGQQLTGRPQVGGPHRVPQLPRHLRHVAVDLDAADPLELQLIDGSLSAHPQGT
jgi:hypothetical protein